MAERARRCHVGSSRGCPCRPKRQRPAESAAAEGKPGPRKRQRPAGTAAAYSKPAPARKHVEAAAAARCRAGRGGTASPMPPPPAPAPRCSLQDLPVELLVEIFARVPGTDLPSLAQACTEFRHILCTNSIWRRRCREEFGVRETLQDLETIGMSYREVYAKLFPYRHILGLWQLDTEHYRTLVNVVVDGLCITGWKYRPSLNTHAGGPIHFKPSFRIRLTERRTPAAVECMDGLDSRPHHRHMQIRKDRFTTQCKNTHHRRDVPMRLRGARGRGRVPEAGLVQRYDWLTYSRLYLPPSHPDDLIRPGLFQYNYDAFHLKIAMLSFHGKYARVTKITGVSKKTLEIHLMRRIQLLDGEIFRNFNELSRVVQEMDEQVTREQQEDRTGESQGHGWPSPAQPSVGTSGAAASEEQPVPFVLPVGVRSSDQSYPRTCRMCFYSVDTVTLPGLANRGRFPGVFILFDENHFGFIWLKAKYFFLYSRVQNTFQNVEAPSPQAFLEMLRNIQSGPLGRSSLHAL